MKKLSFVLVFLLALGVSLTCFAVDFPTLNGSVADGANILDDTAIQMAADRLSRVVDAKVFALTCDNIYDLSDDEYFYRFCEHIGIGRPGHRSFKEDVIVIAVYYPKDEDVEGSLYTWYGDRFTSALDKVDNRIRSDRIGPYLRSNATQAFQNGFEAMGEAIDVYFNPPAPAPVIVEDHREVTEVTIDTEGAGKAARYIFLWIFLAAIIAIGLVLYFVKIKPWRLSRKRLIARITRVRKESVDENAALRNRLPENPNDNPSMAQISLVVGSEEPKAAKAYGEAYVAQRAELLEIQSESVSMRSVEIGYFVDFEAMKKLGERYKQLEERRETVLAWLDELNEEAQKIQAMIESVPGELEKATGKLGIFAAAYNELVGTVSLLPKLTVALKPLNDIKARVELLQSKNKPLGALAQIELLLDSIKEAKEDLLKLKILDEAIGKTREAVSKVCESDDRILEVDGSFCHVDKATQKVIATFVAGEYDSVDSLYSDLISRLVTLENVYVSFAGTLGVREDYIKRIQVITDEGYKNIAVDDIREAKDDEAHINKLLSEGKFEEALHCVGELENDIRHGLVLMVNQKALKEKNNEGLAELASGVAKQQQRLVSEVAPFWANLQERYRRENWDNVGDNFDRAFALLDALFDDPSDANDLASEISRLNDFNHQEFEEAEDLLERAESDLGEATVSLDSLCAQYAKVVKAKEFHQKALELATTKLASARKVRNTNDELIGANVDKLINQAREALNEAGVARDNEIYVDVMGFCQEVHSLCDKAISSSKTQVGKINSLIEGKNDLKKSVRSEIASVEKLVKETTRAAIGQGVYSSLSSANSHIKAAASHEVRALSLEDNGMTQALENSVASYQSALKEAQAAKRSLDNDIASYTRLISSAKSAVSSAESAISRARRECSDHRAGLSGSSVLRRARSLVSRVPQYGTTREAIKRAIHNADDAEREANNARRNAQDAIQDHIRREREEEERRQRAAERRRREAMRSSYSSSSSSFSGSSFGGGGGGSFGGGGGGKSGF